MSTVNARPDITTFRERIMTSMAAMSTIHATLQSLLNGEETTPADRRPVRAYLDHLDVQDGPASDLKTIKRAEEIAHENGHAKLMNDLYAFGLELGSR